MRFLRLILLSFALSQACDYMSMPTDFATVPAGTRANLKANFSEVENKFNPCADSVAEMRERFSGYSTSFLISSLEHLRLRLDADGTTTGKLLVEGGSGDSLFRVSESFNSKFFGHLAIDSNLTVRKVTASDSLIGTIHKGTKGVFSDTVIGAHLKTAGNLIVGGTGAITGALSSGAFSATTGSFSSTLGVTGVTTATGGLTLGARFIDATAAITNGTTSVTTAHSTIFADGTSGTVTLNLPAASGNAGLTYTIYDIDATANAVTVDGNSSETIGGATTVVLGGNSGNGVLVIVCDGTNWRIKQLYEEGSFTGTLTGVSGSVTGTIRYVRVGKQVAIMIPELVGTSNTTACTITGMPATIYPAVAQGFSSVIINNTVISTGMTSGIHIETNGVITLVTSGNPAGFTSSGSKGFMGEIDLLSDAAATFTYSLQ